MSSNDAEVYVEMTERSRRASVAFFDAVLPLREERRDLYEVPDFTDTPTRVHETADALLLDLEANPTEPYAVCMGATRPGWPRMAMLFFTEDGGCIAGVVVPEDDAVEWLERLSECVGGEFGYAVHHQRPPDTLREFRQWAEEPSGLRLVQGVVLGDWDDPG